MVRDTVSHLRAEGQQVFLDAEHFFDGYRANRDYALEVLRTADEAGAEVVALCDTNGGMLPGWVADVVHDVDRDHRRPGRHPLPQRHRLRGGQHAGRRRRRRHPRAGHAQRVRRAHRQRRPDHASWPTSSSSWTARCCPQGLLREATRIAHAIAEVTNVPPASRQPYVGASRVRAQGRAARQRDQGRPEPLPAHRPGRGRQRHAAAGLRHGRAGLDRAQGPRARLRPLRRPATWSPGSPTGSRRWSQRGYTFEAADASFELLLVEEVEGRRPSYFEVESWRVITETRPGEEAVSEATVKLRADGVRYVVTGEGNGPVNALDHALREAIGQAYPEVAKFELIDYKVRILDRGHGTDAITRVLIETTDGATSWVTVGVGAQRHRGVLGGAGRRADLRPAPAPPAALTSADPRSWHDLTGDQRDRRGAAPPRPQRHRGLLRGRLLVAGHVQRPLRRARRHAAGRLQGADRTRHGRDVGQPDPHQPAGLTRDPRRRFRGDQCRQGGREAAEGGARGARVIAAMPEADRVIAEKLHEVIPSSAPMLRRSSGTSSRPTPSTARSSASSGVPDRRRALPVLRVHR